MPFKYSRVTFKTWIHLKIFRSVDFFQMVMQTPTLWANDAKFCTVNKLLYVEVVLTTEIPQLPTWLTLIAAWISNYIHYNVWDEITYPYSNFNGSTVEVWEWISNSIPHFAGHVITQYGRTIGWVVSSVELYAILYEAFTMCCFRIGIDYILWSLIKLETGEYMV